MQNLHCYAAAGFVFAASAITLFGQGSLTPPAPPGPSMKSLDQIDADIGKVNATASGIAAKAEKRIPVDAAHTRGNDTNTFIITAPGSYYLTGNVTGASGKHGISIQADDVTLDLNGFALISGGSGIVHGIDVPAAQTGICIRNGTVRGWSGDGVHGQAATMLAEKLRVTNNTASVGLAAGNGSLIKDCVASGNDTGFIALDRTHIINCISTVNTGAGFNCTSYVTVLDCTSSRNTGSGFLAQANCTVERCSATRNGEGGIVAASGSTVRGCNAEANGASGIDVQDNCQVLWNTCDLNNQTNKSGAGIVTSNGNLVDGNSCSLNVGSNGDGFYIAGVRNLVIRNSARGNGTNYHFYINNRYGTIVDLTATNTVTPGGNSASGTTGTSDPWANFAW